MKSFIVRSSRILFGLGAFFHLGLYETLKTSGGSFIVWLVSLIAFFVIMAGISTIFS